MPRFWFKPKSIGYGAYPVTWQGWALIAGFIAIDLAFAYALLGPSSLSGEPPEAGRLAVFLIGTAAFTAAFILVCIARTEGEWKWRWPGRAK